MASSNLGFYVREMETYEVDTFLAITQENGLYYGQRDIITRIREKNSSGLLVAVTSNKEQIIGTCCFLECSETRGIISSLAVTKDCEKQVEVLRELLSAAFCYTNKTKLVYIYLPKSFRSFDIPKPYVKLREIHLYSVNAEEIKLTSVENEMAYSIEPFDFSVECSATLHFTNAKGTRRTIFLKGPLPHFEVGFQLSLGDTVIGYGIMSKNSADKWMISPVYATDMNAGKHIMRNILSYIVGKGLRCKILTYVFRSNNIARDFLVISGFVPSEEWILYCASDSSKTLTEEASLQDLEIVTFSEGNLFYSVL